jgi:hypothetical protein
MDERYDLICFYYETSSIQRSPFFVDAYGLSLWLKIEIHGWNTKASFYRQMTEITVHVCDACMSFCYQSTDVALT